MYADQVFTSLLSVEQALDFDVGGAELVDPTETGSGSLVVSFGYNATDSRIYGVQVDGGLQLPRGFNLDWTALWVEAEIEEALAIRDFRLQADVAPEEAVFRSIDGHRLPHTPRFRLNASLSQSFRLSALVLDYVVSIGWRSEQHRTIFNGRDFLHPDDPRLRPDDLVESFWSVDAGAGATWNKLRIEGFVSNVTGEKRPRSSRSSTTPGSSPVLALPAYGSDTGSATADRRGNGSACWLRGVLPPA